MDKKKLEATIKEAIEKSSADIKNYRMQSANVKLYDEDGTDCIKVGILFVKENE